MQSFTLGTGFARAVSLSVSFVLVAQPVMRDQRSSTALLVLKSVGDVAVGVLKGEELADDALLISLAPRIASGNLPPQLAAVASSSSCREEHRSDLLRKLLDTSEAAKHILLSLSIRELRVLKFPQDERQEEEPLLESSLYFCSLILTVPAIQEEVGTGLSILLLS